MNQMTMSSLFTSEKERWIDEARSTARLLLQTRDYITIEDVLRECPRPSYLHRNTTGAVFGRGFRSVGFVKSKSPTAKGRWIQQWALS